MTTSTVSNPSSFLQDLHNDHFRTIVAQVAATMEKPEYGDRLQKAVTLVLSNSVSLHDDGTATVKSGNRTYELTQSARVRMRSGEACTASISSASNS